MVENETKQMLDKADEIFKEHMLNGYEIFKEHMLNGYEYWKSVNVMYWSWMHEMWSMWLNKIGATPEKKD